MQIANTYAIGPAAGTTARDAVNVRSAEVAQVPILRYVARSIGTLGFSGRTVSSRCVCRRDSSIFPEIRGVAQPG